MAYDPDDRASGVQVLDTFSLPRKQALNLYRDLMCTAYTPWTPKVDPEADFRVRMEVALLPKGSIARHFSTPHTVARTADDVSKSNDEAIGVSLILSGRHYCEQAGREVIAKPGDVLLVDGAEPIKVVCGPQQHDVLTVSISKSRLKCNLPGDKGSNRVISRDLRPFSNLLAVLADRLCRASETELAAYFEAVTSLLPVAAGIYDADDEDDLGRLKSNLRLGEIVDYINRHLSLPELSPVLVATAFGISVRYLHKLFAVHRTTFGRYVMDRRLERVRMHLASESKHIEAISTIAERWGFKDVSTFYRAFKGKYGCTPSQFRAGFSSR